MKGIDLVAVFGHDEKMMFQKLKGMVDLFPPESEKWFFYQKKICHYLEQCGFQFIETPCLEKTELFARSTGKDTEVVQKQMYSFLDKNEESITLRPEATASVVRSYIENKIYGAKSVQKYFYFGPLFRYERPQKGRQRQFFQYGVEVLGTEDPLADAEVIQVFSDLYTLLEIPFKLLINSLGGRESRSAYLKKLSAYLEKYENELDPESKGRLKTNPLRCFDSKVEATQKIMKTAPRILDFLGAEDQKHFEKVQEYLKMAHVSYEMDSTIVRGLDYYTRTSFEFVGEGLGAKDAICGGGRYDNLVATLGGPATPAIGCAAGMERLMLLAKDPHKELEGVFIVGLGGEAKEHTLKIASSLRTRGVRTLFSFDDKSFKSQLRAADKENVRYALILGENELRNKKVLVKDMKESVQEEIGLDSVEAYFNI